MKEPLKECVILAAFSVQLKYKGLCGGIIGIWRYYIMEEPSFDL